MLTAGIPYLRRAMGSSLEGSPEASNPFVHKLFQPVHLISLHVGVKRLCPQLTESALEGAGHRHEAGVVGVTQPQAGELDVLQCV